MKCLFVFVAVFLLNLLAEAQHSDVVQTSCPAGRTRLVEGLNITVERNSTTCQTHSGLKCMREHCNENLLENAVCVFEKHEDEKLNWTCAIEVPDDAQLNDYVLSCPNFNLTDLVCIDKDCCVLYYDISEHVMWYKSWTAIAIITAIVILAILLAMLVLHCKTVLKKFHDRRRQASESCRVTFSK